MLAANTYTSTTTSSKAQSVNCKAKKIETAPGTAKAKSAAKTAKKALKPQINLDWPTPIAVVPDAENKLLESGVLVRRGEFGPLNQQRQREIERVIKSIGGGITLAQARILSWKVLKSKYAFSVHNLSEIAPNESLMTLERN